MQQQRYYDLIMWGIVSSHRVNLKLALQFHALLIVTIFFFSYLILEEKYNSLYKRSWVQRRRRRGGGEKFCFVQDLNHLLVMY